MVEDTYGGQMEDGEWWRLCVSIYVYVCVENYCRKKRVIS